MLNANQVIKIYSKPGFYAELEKQEQEGIRRKRFYSKQFKLDFINRWKSDGNLRQSCKDFGIGWASGSKLLIEAGLKKPPESMAS